MSNILPNQISKQIKETVFGLCDEKDYLTLGRIESGKFIDELIKNPKVGGIIGKFKPKDRIRTYIKDGCINLYAKIKKMEVRPEDLSPQIKMVFGFSAVVVVDDDKDKGIQIYKKEDSNHEFVVVAHGTYLKWETALRNAILYTATKPFSNENKNKVHFLLALFSPKPITDADRKVLEKALNFSGARFVTHSP